MSDITAHDETVREGFTDELPQVREDLADLTNRAKEKARRSLLTADRSVTEHVYGAIGIAAVLGLLVGFLTRRR
ncbi:glycine zipper domain-containing protein [Ideonella sp. YS5]|uniref:glycine zipper domain-containing protein n=1 Tax=Ideonella sp. YS5 TaxID=3453714 RepID=UPI003EF03D74